MGQLLSTVAEVWESFSLPYKIAIVASFIIWSHSQRRKLPGLFVLLFKNIFLTVLRRLTGRRVHPNYGIKEEVIIGTLRNAFDSVEPSVVTSLMKAPAEYLPHPYPRKEIATSAFKATWYGNDDPDAKIYYYIHGGAYVLGHSLASIGFFTLLIKKLEEKGVKLAVLSLDYSLAPQASFPTPVFEAVAGYEYLLKNLSISPNRIIVGGDSAGGALALALCYQIRESLPPPGGLALLSPWVDSRNPHRFQTHKNRETDIIAAGFLEYGTKAYLQSHQQNHLSSPILGNPQGLPSMLVVWGGLEVFKDDITAFVEKTRKENGEDKVVTLEDPFMPHDFPLLPEVFGQSALTAIQGCADFMENTFKKYD